MAQNPTRVRLIKFNTKRVFSKNRQSVRKALDKVAAEMQAKILQKINTQGPPRSTPGTPPHKETGALHDRHTKVARKGNSIVVRTVQYGVWLEGGTRNMAARPFIRNTIEGRNGDKWVKRVAVLTKKFNALAKSGL